MRRRLSWIACALVFSGMLPAFAASGQEPPHPRDAFALANAAYREAGRSDDAERAKASLEKAIALYRSILKTPIENGYVYYNLGNALARLGRWGEAIHAYRRAERLLPRNRDIQANLALAREKRRDRLPARPVHPLRRAFLFWHDGLSPRETETFALAAYVLTFLAATLWGWTGRRRWRHAAALLLALTLVAGGSLAVKRAGDSTEAVVIAGEAIVRSESHGRSQERFRLHAGAEVFLGRRRDGWVEVELDARRRGWMETRFLRGI